MKKTIFICWLLCTYLSGWSQKKFYLSGEFGMYTSNTFSKLKSGMEAGRLADENNYSFLGLFSVNETNPKIDQSNSGYRIKAGKKLNAHHAIEAGFGQSVNGEIRGYNKGTAYYLYIKGVVNTIFASWVFTDSSNRVGAGFGPCLNLVNYTYHTTNYASVSETKKNQLCPGLLLNAYWNYLNKKSWFLGIRTEAIIASGAKTGDITLRNSSNTNTLTFKSTTAGSFVWGFTFTAGIRF